MKAPSALTDPYEAALAVGLARHWLKRGPTRLLMDMLAFLSMLLPGEGRGDIERLARAIDLNEVTARRALRAR